MRRIAIALLAAMFRASCRSPAPNTTASAGDQPGVAGHYRFSTADLRIDIDIAADGTYGASMDSWAHVTEERGSWHTEGNDIVLKRRSGGLQMPIRRLAPASQAPTGRLQVIEPDSQIARAIVFSKS